MSKNGGAAFPIPIGSARDCNGAGIYNNWQTGMTLRDYFAGQALASHMPKWGEKKDRAGAYENWAECCYAMADAMLLARGQS